VRQAKCFGVADGRGQHVGCRALVSGSGQHIGGSDAFDDPPLRGRRLVVGCEAFREIDGLPRPAGGKQPAETNIPDGERVEQDFLRPAWPGSPAQVPILAHIAAIDTELADRARPAALGGTP
jgi:hypothetical protein